MATAPRDKLRGYGNAERPLLGELWERDSMGLSPAMAARGDMEPSHREVDYARYYDPEFFKQELAKIFAKQWLFACREEDIPQIGDRVPFNVGPHSYIIIRSGEDAFKAFHNSCLHRGTLLCSKKESAETIRCPYHAWEWNADGRLKKIPSHWDFPEITRNNGSLPEIRLERWGGFIFVNADKDAAPLIEALGPMPEHFKAFAPERRYTKARFRKLVAANWKATQEAFQESYHLYATHPEGVPFNGDSQSQYDIFKTALGAVGREAVPSAVPSMHADSSATALAAGMAFAQVQQMWHYPQATLPQVNPAGDVRAQLGQWARDTYEQTYGRANNQPDAVMLDSSLYFLYPQFTLWLSEAVPFVYQFLPHETDPNYCYFDVRLLMPWREGEPLPPAAEMIEIGEHDSIAAMAPAFGFLGMIFDQDMSNLPLVQRGLKAADPAAPHSRLGAYQEGMIQAWHELIDRDLAR
ncbi:aromatic ring-hydroxylating dioxygenase subunit alpha (plasmid) [Sphingobium sp. SJ10-10]|uniref:aromatic ring-hydroxylating oxygenase subunit alpha n=1 Tax=Sphingobium sp. SJ10-10 TaxID=3114999 RepID=UPI002E198B8A|nr:aromatic ring-hydroxylating dioxygenase subunit alpha [Sphingobium sp. SJ10-10]